ncbi:MAG TPA: undecaprenyl-diphosphate phosphatase [Candidatus Paceibacterota bacterium]|nr:undecaprenyl-diphosphate phosphatase [Candidatus Paceibacterota bacterium]
MLTFFQAIVLGALQGLTELFPISSLGHTVILPSLLGWNINQADPFFVSFLVLTHLATALVLFLFFFQDWMRIIKGFFQTFNTKQIAANTYSRLAWLIIVATIPAGLLGLLFQKKLEALFATPSIAAAFLIGNGVLLFLAEYLVRRRHTGGHADDARLACMPWRSAIGIGLMQCLALLPGFSRTGATLAGGLVSGFNHADAARFAFLLATPIIFAAALLKIPHLVVGGGMPLITALAGALSAAICAYIAVKFLTRYFTTKSLTPFAVYCVIAGVVALALMG